MRKPIFAGILLAIIACLLQNGAALAQQSASFKLEEHVFNAGGHPEAGAVLTSAGFKITLDAIGEDVMAASLTSASFHMGGGFGPAYPPPREITGLRFTDKTTLVWDPEKSVGVYNFYRDLISNLAGLGFGNCQQQDLVAATAMDADAVPLNDGFFYLATAENRLDEEGTKGSRSNGTERMGTACP